MRLSDNFTLEEFTHSDTAERLGIDNTPSPEIIAHITELVAMILQPLRTAYDKPLIISSGYRCPELNKAVGGSKTSAHLTGYAADVVPADGDVESFIAFAESWLRENDVAFDQSIDEVNKYGVEWWHIALYKISQDQRRQFMSLEKA